MKKIAIFLLAVFYLGITTGVVVSKHFCMNRLDSWELYGNVDDQCGRCGMETSKEKHGCCHDEVQIVKLHADQKPTLVAFNFEWTGDAILPPAYPFTIETQAIADVPVSQFNHSPPLLSEQDRYLRNCVFRI